MLSFFLFSVTLTLGFSAPNLVFFLTDDQDITLQGFSQMPKTKSLLVDQGLTFKNAFVHSPICCISRASILSGRYVHNHHTHNNTVSGGCSDSFWQQNIEPYCYAPNINYNNNYNTFYAGKYLNTYGQSSTGGTKWIPKGFGNWYGLVGNSKYYGYQISNNGTTESFDHNYTTDYYTDVIKRQALNFLTSGRATLQNKPFLMVCATPAAHAPFIPAPQYNNTASNLIAPRTPNWNNVNCSKTKHQLMRLTPAMNPTLISQSDQTWRFRLGTLKSVDDLVEAVYNQIKSMNLLNNTYFLYTSDHGFHLGQYGMAYDKRQLYENDIRIPFFVSGPNIPKGKITDIIALNIDIAPTLIELSGSKVPNYMDGRSLVPYLFNNDDNDKDEFEDDINVNQQFLIEYYGEQYNANTGISMCGGYPGAQSTICDMWNNSYHCIRSINGKANEVNGSIYCDFLCFDWGRNSVPCEPNTVDAQGEYYNLEIDYFELNNSWTSLTNQQVTNYKNLIDQFMSCSGQTNCNALRES